jgi:hypothetical protein
MAVTTCTDDGCDTRTKQAFRDGKHRNRASLEVS